MIFPHRLQTICLTAAVVLIAIGVQLIVVVRGKSTTTSTTTTSDSNTETCILNNDGICLPSIPELPNEDKDGYIIVKYGEAQIVAGNSKTLQYLQDTQNYMYKQIYNTNDTIIQSISNHCTLQNEQCTYWCSIGECDVNPKYMRVQCAPCCYTCHELSLDYRCPVPDDINKHDIWKSGDLNKMFQRIENDINNNILNGNVVLKPGMKNLKYNDSPWVIVLDNFLTDNECDTLIQLGTDRGYERSKDVGTKQFDGTYDSYESTGRTSTNTWCLDECYNNTITQNVINKLELLTQIPDTNSEYLQLLKYEIGQFYETHHDYIRFHLDRAQGVRILTVFLYLNDVEEGGGTDFPNLGVTVDAKKGRALLWPSVLNEDPNKKDRRTEHQALPVLKGIKYGANAWLHQRDFKETFANNCIG